MGKKKKKGDDAEVAEEGAAPKPPGKGKTMLTGAVLVMVGAMGYKFVLAGTPSETVLVSAPVDASTTGHPTSEADCSELVMPGAEGADAHGAKPHAKSGGAAAGTVTLSEMTIKLADADAAHYLKVGIALELGEGVVAEEFEAEKAKASDVAVRFFSRKKAAELEGPEAIESLKTELTCLVQAAYAEPVEPGAKKPAKETPPKVAAVLFTQFLMQ